jgi:hypothetical protein
MSAAAAATKTSFPTTAGVLRYRGPTLLFVPIVGLLFLHLNLAYQCEISADGQSVVIPRWLAEAEATRALSVGGSPANVFAGLLQAAQLALYRDVQPIVLAVGLRLFQSINVLRLIAHGAVAAHVVEMLYALKLCKDAKASALVTAKYAVMVFIGGFTQLKVLKSQVARLKKGQ